MKVAKVCRLFGHCRQAFYQSKADISVRVGRERTLLSTVREIRSGDPGIGGYKLWTMLMSVFGSGFVPGRDSFFSLLRRHHLMLPPPKARHTTNSNHRYRKWKNLIRGIDPMSPNTLWVADITCIPLNGGDACYLHLITDAYSHKIVGWELADTLRASATLKALSQAIGQAVARRGGDDLSGLIHHSDRGVQYCCDTYVDMLKAHNISISMTEDYKPTDNAVAERVNGIIKTEMVYRKGHFDSVEQARDAIGNYIRFYNDHRPHMSIGYKTPAAVHWECGPQKKMWRTGKGVPANCTSGGKDAILQDQGKSQGESICQST